MNHVFNGAVCPGTVVNGECERCGKKFKVPIKLTMTIELTDRIAKAVSQNSIERVINTTLRILEDVEHPDRHVNEEDWKEAKSTVTMLWIRLQDAIFRHTNKMEPQS